MHNFSATKKRLFLFILFGWLLLLVGDRVGELRQYQGSFVAMYTLAIASIILLTGYSGQLSLGHSALMAVGAYAGALSTNNAHLHPVIALIIATFVAGLFGLILGFGVARLSGPYLAGTTLALAVSLPSLANQFPILGGEQGVAFDVGAPPARFGEAFSQYKWFFWISSLAALIMIWLISNLLSSKYGRSFRAMRDNQVAAQLTGINTGRLKVTAFTISAGVAGLAGSVKANARMSYMIKPVGKAAHSWMPARLMAVFLSNISSWKSGLGLSDCMFCHRKTYTHSIGGGPQ